MLEEGTQVLVKSDDWQCNLDEYNIVPGKWALCTYSNGKFYVNKTCYYSVWTEKPIEYRLVHE